MLKVVKYNIVPSSIHHVHAFYRNFILSGVEQRCINKPYNSQQKFGEYIRNYHFLNQVLYILACSTFFHLNPKMWKQSRYEEKYNNARVKGRGWEWNRWKIPYVLFISIQYNQYRVGE